MYQGLLHTHSGLRWILLVLIIINVFNALGGLTGNKVFTAKDKKLSFYALIFTHVQALLGLALYFMSPKVEFSENTMSNSVLRFFHNGAYFDDAHRHRIDHHWKQDG